MEWYFYLHYVIYRFYDRKKDAPVFTAIILTSLFLFLNIMTVLMAHSLIFYFWQHPTFLIPHHRISATIELSFLGLINYLLLYKGKKYEDVFDEFGRNAEKYKKTEKSVKIYIFTTIILALLAFFITGWRNEQLHNM